jgi:hypothetical protein
MEDRFAALRFALVVVAVFLLPLTAQASARSVGGYSKFDRALRLISDSSVITKHSPILERNIASGTFGENEFDNMVWGTVGLDSDNIVWGTLCEAENIVWGTLPDGENIVWGTLPDGENIVWGTLPDAENIVWVTYTTTTGGW